VLPPANAPTPAPMPEPISAPDCASLSQPAENTTPKAATVKIVINTLLIIYLLSQNSDLSAYVIY
jgi:hypothetical protein